MHQAGPLFARCLVTAYFVALGVGFWLVEWRHFSALSLVAVLYASIFFADFLSGLGHLFIDYCPLSYKKGLNELLFYAGDRGSDSFNRKRREIFKLATFFDIEVYYFKLHHRHIQPNIQKPYSTFFCEIGVGAAAILVLALVVVNAAADDAVTHHAAFALLIVSLGTLHADVIHSWSHGSKTMPLGVKAVAVLRRLGLMYSAETHMKHHQHGETGFCFITGHANFLVDRICRWLLVRGLISKRHWHGER